MKHRFFVDHGLSPGATVALGKDESHHARVLRVRDGEEVEVFDGLGNNFVARYESQEAVHLLRAGANRETPAPIHLAMAVIQLEKFELVLQKATELGAQSITPLLCDRTEVRPERYQGKSERWRKIVFEAAKQSGRSRIPLVNVPSKFDELMDRDGIRVVFDADCEAANAWQPEKTATLFIGPEGGWSERELALARANGASFERLGPRRLRAETAAIAAMTIVALR
jgi:16S rRNA (uracil1498-N3)-methyltransferase